MLFEDSWCTYLQGLKEGMLLEDSWCMSKGRRTEFCLRILSVLARVEGMNVA